MVEYVRIKNIKEGMVLAKNVYDDRGRILLGANHVIKGKMIPIFQNHGYKGIYIQNDSNVRIESIPVPEPLIPDHVRIHMIRVIKETYDNKEKFYNAYDPTFHKQRDYLEEFVADLQKDLQRLDEADNLLMEMEDTHSVKNYIYNHMLNTCLLSMGIATKLGLDAGFVTQCGIAGLYSDMGKGALPESLVFKKNPSDEDLKLLKEHPEKMFRILQQLNYPINISYGIWMHHERIDGTGFPMGIKLEKIVLSAQIVAVASKFNNLISSNPYIDHPMSLNEALEWLQGCGIFNTACIRALLEFVVPFPIGTYVKLSNKKTALVLKNRANIPLRPYIVVDGKMIDMAKEYLDVTIISE